VTKTKLCNDVLTVTENETLAELWHRWLGHKSEKGMQDLAHMEFLPELNGITLKPCEHCFAGKQHRVAFCTRLPHRAENVLDTVHTDVCSMTEKSLDGALYFVKFIHDHSRKIFLYVLRNNWQVIDVFKEFHANVERQTGRKLKSVRSDNGGEYQGPFEWYCGKFGIGLEKTPPKIPYLNGLAERMNMTLTKRVTAMFSHAKLPNSFWAKTLNHTIYVLNLSP
jgi:hypothetical protein